MADQLIFYTHPMSRGPNRQMDARGDRAALSHRAARLRHDDEGGCLSRNQSDGEGAAIRHGDVVVTEAAAICAYLADVFPEARFAPPAGDRLRGPYYRWLFFAAVPVEAAWTNKAMGFVVPQGRERMMGYGRFEDVVNALEGAVSQREYLVGDSFTAADVYVGSGIGFGMQFGTIDKRPAFEQYWGRISARPAALRAKEIDDTLAAEKAQPSVPPEPT